MKVDQRKAEKLKMDMAEKRKLIPTPGVKSS
jgi:hypothetical protein